VSNIFGFLLFLRVEWDFSAFLLGYVNENGDADEDMCIEFKKI
jgi:hypothetical protein